MTIGAKKARVEFVDDVHEGKRDWVSPARLEVAWDRLDDYLEQEARRDAVFAQRASKTEVWAYFLVLCAMPKDLVEVGTLGRGESIVLDLDGLACFLRITPEVILGGDPYLEDEDGLTVSPPITERVVRLAAPLIAAPLLDELLDQEAIARRRSAIGYEFESYEGDEIFVSAADAARYFERNTAPAHALVRRWIGAEESARVDELHALRAQLAHTAKVAHYAIRDLEALRSNTSAAKHRKELSEPTAEWFGHGLSADELTAARQHLYPYRWREECNCTFGTPGRPPHRGQSCIQLERRPEPN